MGCTHCLHAPADVEDVFTPHTSNNASVWSLMTISSGVIHSKIDYVKTAAANSATREHRGLAVTEDLF